MSINLPLQFKRFALTLRGWLEPSPVLGLLVSRHEIGAVRLAHTFKGWTIDRALHRVLPAGAGAAEALQALRNEEDLKAAAVVSGISAARASLRRVSVSFDNPKAVARIIRYQMEPFIAEPIDDQVVDFIAAAEPRSVFAAAVPQHVAGTHLKRLAAAELNPQATTLDEFALLNLYCWLNRGEPNRTEAIVNLAGDHTGIQIIADGVPALMRVLPKLGEDLGPVEQTLALHGLEGEMDACERVLLTGGEATEDLAAAVGKQLQLPTRLWRPFDGLEGPDGRIADPLQARLAVPLGLAICNFAHKPRKTDFRGAEMADPQAAKIKNAAVFLASACALLVLLFTLYTYQRLSGLEARYATLKNSAEQILIETFPQTSQIVKGRELAQMKQKIEQAKASYQWLQAVGNGPTALESLQELTRAMARLPSVKLETFVIDKIEIRLQGRTRTFEIVDRLKQELGRSKRFGEITLVDAELDNRDRSVRFSFSIKRR